MGIRRASLALLLALPVWAQYVPGGSAAGGGGGGSSTPPSASYTGTSFLWAFGSLAGNATEANVQVQAPATGTYSNMSVTLGTTPGVGAGLAFTLRDAAADTTLTCSTGNTKTCQDFTHSASITQGDLIDIKVVATGTPAATTVVIVFSTPGIAGPTGPAGSPIVPGSNDTNVTLGISSGIITPGWQNVLGGARGGLGANAAAFTGALWMASGLGRVALSSDTFPGGAAGNAATASALASAPSQCAAGNFPLGISTSGNSQNCTRLPQTFFGTAAPGVVTGNLPGDLFSDSTNHNAYWCNASSGTAAPACTSVTTGGWTLANAGTSSGTGIQKGTGGGGFAGATADTDYQSAVVRNVISAGAKCDGVTDDHAALQTAANTAGIWYFPPDRTCLVGDSGGAGTTGVTLSTTGVTWIGNSTTLLKKTSSTGDMLWFRSGALLTLDGFIIDQNGQASSGGDNYTTVALDGTVPILRNILFKNSGTANSSGAFWAFNSGVQAYNVTIDPTLTGGTSGQFFLQGVPAGSITKIDKSSFNAGNWNQLFIKGGGTGSEISVTDSWFNGVNVQAGDTGQTGNAILCFQCIGKLTVRGNHFIKPIFSAVRLNQTFPGLTWRGTWLPGFTYAANDGVSYKGYLYNGQTASNLGNQPDVSPSNWTIVGDLHAVVDSNVVDGAGEASIYAEFGTEGSVISNNKIMNGSSAIVSTNLSSRAYGIHNLIIGNQAVNMNLKCFHIESDTLSGNSCSNSPLGVEIGFGGTGQANNIGPNTWTNVTVPIAADASLGNTPANQVTAAQIYSGTGDQGAAQVASPAAIAFSAGTTLNISNISNAASAVVTFSSGTQPSVGQVYLLTMIYGMDQMNGQLCTVTASTLTTFTCSINSSTFSAWATNPVGDANPQAMLIYSSGTAMSSAVPSAVIGLNGLVASLDTTGLTANLGTQTLFSSAPAAGLYRTSCYMVITRAATTSSTTPNCALVYTKEGDTGGSGALGWFSGGITSNVVGQGVNTTDENTVRLQAGSNLQLSTVNYASVGGTTMQYAVHVRVYYLGP